MRGRGVLLEPRPALTGWAALVKPKAIHCATTEIYRRWDQLRGIKPGTDNAMDRSFPAMIHDGRPTFYNSLYHAVASVHPDYEIWLWMLKRAGFGRTALTGSGAAFFSWAPTQALANAAVSLFIPEKFDVWALPLVSQSCVWSQ